MWEDLAGNGSGYFMLDAVEILRQLIAIPSVNPDGDPGTSQTGEAECAAWIADFLRTLGATVHLEEVLPGRPNVIGKFPTHISGRTKPHILLGPHTDTVSVAGMTVAPFGGEIRHGRIYGRGASDTKGTAAAMLAALAELGREIPNLGAEVTFVGFMGEESAQWGSRHFAQHHRGFSFALVGEPTECRVVHTHKGCLWSELTTRGRAVHGSTPELGDNAILKMLPVLAELDTDFRTRIADPGLAHSVLGNSSLNLGMIRGGTRANIVPDACTLTLDMRLTPALYSRGADDCIRHWLEEKGWSQQVEYKSLGSCAPLDTDPENPLVQALARAGSGLASAPWFCDAAWLAAEGIPAVAAGPGSIAQAHTADEFIEIDALLEGVAFYRRFLESI